MKTNFMTIEKWLYEQLYRTYAFGEDNSNNKVFRVPIVNAKNT